MDRLLTLRNLSIQFYQNRQTISVVKEVNLEIREGEIVGLVGESGSGKTITTLAITRILPHNALVSGGEIVFRGSDILHLQEEQLQHIRGKEIAYIFQEPTMFLNPILSVGMQVAEAIEAHGEEDRDSNVVKSMVIELFKRVALPEPSDIFFSYPHQLSGGMNQRVMIAQALASNPRLLIADEPTTSLDMETEREIIELLIRLQREFKFSCLFITHNLALVRQLCQRVYVMYRGAIVEEAETDKIFTSAQHEHTKALLKAYLRLGGRFEIGGRGIGEDIRNFTGA